jgi:hypothetical protein
MFDEAAADDLPDLTRRATAVVDQHTLAWLECAIRRHAFHNTLRQGWAREETQRGGHCDDFHCDPPATLYDGCLRALAHSTPRNAK